MSIPDVITDIDELHTHGLVTGAEAAEIVGTTYRRIDMWANNGIVPPTLDASGRGTRRGYGLDDLVKAVLVNDLYDAGLTAYAAKMGASQAARGPASVTYGTVTVTLDSQQARDKVFDAWFETINGSDT